MFSEPSTRQRTTLSVTWENATELKPGNSGCYNHNYNEAHKYGQPARSKIEVQFVHVSVDTKGQQLYTGRELGQTKS